MHAHINAILRRQAGVTLVELMVALAIGAFLMIGAITVFMQSRMTFRVTESVARLQENARFALDTLEPDIRMANFWGLTSRANKIVNRAGPADPAGIGPATCGNNWTIDLDAAIAATNGSAPWPWGPCAGVAPVEPAADTLVVRRVSEDQVPPAGPGLKVQSARFQDSIIFTGAVPAAYSATTSDTHQLIVNGYYVSQSSSLGNGVPSLRRKTLMGDGTIQDQEILPGVEDMQIQLGVDTDLMGDPDRGSIDRYVNPGDPIITPGNAAFLPEAVVLSVRLWLRLRAEGQETGFIDTASYVYGDRNIPAIGDAFRRVLVSKTIYLRNARPAS